MIALLQTRFPEMARAVEFLDGVDADEEHPVQIPLHEVRQILMEHQELLEENTNLAQLANQKLNENVRLKKEVQHQEAVVEMLSSGNGEQSQYEQ